MNFFSQLNNILITPCPLLCNMKIGGYFKVGSREFPCCLVVRIPGFHYGGPGSSHGQGTELRSHNPHVTVKKKKKGINK